MNKRINGKWLCVVPKEEQEDFTRRILSVQDVLDVLKNIAESQIESADNVNPSDYNCPSWAYKEADRHGYIRAWKEVLELTKATER